MSAAPAAPAAPTAGGATEAPVAPIATPSSDTKVRLAYSETPIERVVSDLARQTGKNVVARGKTSGQRVASIIARDITLERALDMIVAQKPNWLWYKPEDQPNTYEIWDQESFRAEVLPRQVRQKVFVPREITAEDASKAIQSVITPNIGSVNFDPRSNKVIVTDLPATLELVQRLIEQIDVRFMTRVFYIRHAEIGGIAEKLANLKSPAAPAPEQDERTHQIIVRDRLDIIRQMELLVETLDVGPEMRVYDLNNIGFEGANRQDIEDAITAVTTPNAFMRINNLAGRLLLEDVPEVHEKVEKILQTFDQPAKQVLVQAEVIETDFSEGFNYSIDWAFSQDLFAATIDQLTGGLVPTGSGNAKDPNTLGFIDFRKEFPVVTGGGSSGLVVQNLSKHAYFILRTAMNNTRTRVLQQPRLLIENQREVIFNVGQKIPYYTGGSIGYQTNNNVNNPYYTASQPVLNFINTGLDMAVRPTISNNGLVELEVEIRNNSASLGTLTFANQSYTAPTVNTQELQSTLIIPSGETRVIGGLITDSKSESKKGVPGLINIPVLGPLLFGSVDRPQAGNLRRNLLLFLTPTIVLERPTDLHKYKGKVIVDENEVEMFTSPTATLSDVQVEPMPMEQPGMTSGINGSQLEKPSLSAGEALPIDQLRPEVTEPVLPLPSESSQGEQEPLASEGTSELKRIHIAEQVSSGPAALIPVRLAGQSGALTGTGVSGKAGTPGTTATGAPAAAAGTTGAPPTPAGAVPPAAAAPAAPAPPAAPAATPAPTAPPAPAAPARETRY